MFLDTIASSGEPMITCPSAAVAVFPLPLEPPPNPLLPLYLIPVLVVSTLIFPPEILIPPEASAVYVVPATVEQIL